MGGRESAHSYIYIYIYLFFRTGVQVQELLLALTPRLQDPESLRGLLEMHLESKQIDALQVTTRMR